MESSSVHPPRWLYPLILALLLGCGIWLRLPTSEDWMVKGFDESIYTRYVTLIRQNGVFSFPRLSTEYLQLQPERNAFLPPTRVLFIASGAVMGNVTGLDSKEAIRAVSFTASCAILLLGAAFAWRAAGPGAAVGITALMVCAPTQIHMAHRALIDGFFGFLALLTIWGLWESLRNPQRRLWLVVYGAGLAGMVLTKENAFFVFVAVCGILVVDRWLLPIGKATPALYIVTLCAPATGAVLLLIVCGGLSTLSAVYRLNVAKSMVLPYAIATGDGPWYRYLLDLLTVSPLVFLLAVSSLSVWSREERLKPYLTMFVVFTYLIMCQVKYGMNLRYGNMWDLPLRWLAFGQLVVISSLLPRYKIPSRVLLTAIVCTLELQQYVTVFADNRIYDPTPEVLLHALQILK